MEKQSKENHIRFYYPHHFIFYPLLLVLIGIAFWYLFNSPTHQTEMIFVIILLFLVGWLSFMLRQHYALTLQNRLVRLEMRFRYYRITGSAFEDIEENLSFGQIAALRFAGDNELPGLVTQTLSKNLQPDEIKKKITNWKADHMRV